MFDWVCFDFGPQFGFFYSQKKKEEKKRKWSSFLHQKAFSNLDWNLFVCFFFVWFVWLIRFDIRSRIAIALGDKQNFLLSLLSNPSLFLFLFFLFWIEICSNFFSSFFGFISLSLALLLSLFQDSKISLFSLKRISMKIALKADELIN